MLGLTTPMGKKLWCDFELTTRSPFDLLPGKYHVDLLTHALTLSELELSKVVFPKGATLVAVSYGVLEIDFTALTFLLHTSTTVLLGKDSTTWEITLPLLS